MTTVTSFSSSTLQTFASSSSHTDSLSLEEILQHLQHINNKLRGIYVYGSRLYGTAAPNSDYDLIVIFDNFSEQFKDAEFTLQNGIQKVEAHFMDTKDYVTAIRMHSAVELVTLWLPNEFVLYEDDAMNEMRTFWIAKMNIQSTKLLKLLSWEAYGRCLPKSKRLWHSDDKLKAKKNLAHAIRYLLFGIQIMSHGKILDYKDGYEYFEELVVESSATSFEALEARATSICDKLSGELSVLVKEVTGKGTSMFHQHNVESQNPEQLLVVEFVKQYGVAALSKYFDMFTFPISSKGYHEQGKVVVAFHVDRAYSNMESKLVQQSWHGLTCIIRLKRQLGNQELSNPFHLLLDPQNILSIDPICYSYAAVPHLSNVYDDTVLLEVKKQKKKPSNQSMQLMREWIPSNIEQQLQIHYKFAGHAVSMYFDATCNQWRIAHKDNEQQWLSAHFGLSVSASGLTAIEQAFWEVWNEHSFDYPDDTSRCYLFSLIPDTLRSTHSKIVLHGIRELKTLELLHGKKMSLNNKNNYPIASQLHLEEEKVNIEDLFHLCSSWKTLNPETYSGLMLSFRSTSDSALVLVKIESPLWHYMKILRPAKQITFQNLNLIAVQSFHNEACLLQVLRHHGIADLTSTIDEQVLRYYNPTYLDLYHNLKAKYISLCQKTDAMMQSEVVQQSTSVDQVLRYFQRTHKRKLRSFEIAMVKHMVQSGELLKCEQVIGYVHPNGQGILSSFKVDAKHLLETLLEQ